MRASQVIKKKGRHPNPPPFESFTFKRHYVVTCAQTPDQVWTETVANMGTEIKKEFNDYDWSEARSEPLLVRGSWGPAEECSSLRSGALGRARLAAFHGPSTWPHARPCPPPR